MRNINEATLAKLAVAYSGFAWGLFWLPLRALDGAGIHGLWAVILFQALPGLLLLPVLALRWRQAHSHRATLMLLGLATAVPMVLYSASLLATDILRAMVLFYMMPVWSTVLDRLVFGTRVNPVRLAAIALAFAAMAIMFGEGVGLPLPRNAGDVMALAAGFLWSLATVLLRRGEDQSPLDLAGHFFLWSSLLATGLVALAPLPAPPLALVAAQLWWLVPSLAVVVMTGVYASMWGAPKISPGLSGLLYMTEISAGTITAALWSGEAFGWREAVGVALITLVGALEGLIDVWRVSTARRRTFP
jgi:drug/metabolite transporter (DMT)-like permease